MRGISMRKFGRILHDWNHASLTNKVCLAFHTESDFLTFAPSIFNRLDKRAFGDWSVASKTTGLQRQKTNQTHHGRLEISTQLWYRRSH